MMIRQNGHPVDVDIGEQLRLSIGQNEHSGGSIDHSRLMGNRNDCEVM